MSLYIDLSEFMAVPMRTGIQRIGGEICRYLPPGSAIPVQLNDDHYVALPPALLDAIGAYFRHTGDRELDEIRRLCGSGERTRVEISKDDTVLVPEIFGESRATFFRRLTDEQLQRCRFIVYDLLPFTHPEYFPPDMPLAMSGYFHVVKQASCCGFISEHTRETYYGRLKRTNERSGSVLPLGCDSLGHRPERLQLDRPLTFTVLGTIEPRKNHGLILEVFEPLMKQIGGLSLVFVVKLGWVDATLAHKVRALAADENSGFRFYPSSSDDAIRGLIEQSRATIYVSAAEGYGLPPVESLWLGTPVIASRAIPSLENLGTKGIHYVEPVSVGTLRRAVIDFLDEDYARKKIQETAELNLPTWKSFTQEVLDWCGQTSSRPTSQRSPDEGSKPGQLMSSRQQ